MHHIPRSFSGFPDRVEGIDPAPHIHEQFTIQKWLRMATTLRILSRTWTCTTRSTEHTARRSLMHIGVTSHLWLKSALHASSHPRMRTCVLRCGCFLLACLCSLLRPTVLLPALPDVHLSVQREVQVQPPVRLPLGDRGHLRPRDTPHRL